jgi:transcriptional regulator with XRE-family HTH domain
MRKKVKREMKIIEYQKEKAEGFRNRSLYEARIVRGYTEQRFAELTGMTLKQIKGFEKKEVPTVSDVNLFSFILYLPYEYFFKEPIANLQYESPIFWNITNK